MQIYKNFAFTNADASYLLHFQFAFLIFYLQPPNLTSTQVLSLSHNYSIQSLYFPIMCSLSFTQLHSHWSPLFFLTKNFLFETKGKMVLKRKISYIRISRNWCMEILFYFIFYGWKFISAFVNQYDHLVLTQTNIHHCVCKPPN